MKVLLPESPEPWDFVVFGGGFGFFRFVLLSHTHSHKFLSTYVTSMHLLKAGAATRILLVAYVGSYLPF